MTSPCIFDTGMVSNTKETTCIMIFLWMKNLLRFICQLYPSFDHVKNVFPLRSQFISVKLLTILQMMFIHNIMVGKKNCKLCKFSRFHSFCAKILLVHKSLSTQPEIVHDRGAWKINDCCKIYQFNLIYLFVYFFYYLI